MSEPNPPTLSLDYATLDSDGNPEFVPEAEAAIDRGDSPNSIARHFRKAKLAKAYIAKSFRRRFGYDSLGDACLRCQSPAEDYLTISWLYRAPTKIIGFYFANGDLQTDVITHHPICTRCLDEWLDSQRLPDMLTQTARWLFYLGAGATIFHWLSRLPPNRYGGTLLTIYLSIMAVSVLLDGLSGLLIRRRAPKAVQQLMPRWLKLHGVVGWGRQDDVRGEVNMAGNETLA